MTNVVQSIRIRIFRLASNGATLFVVCALAGPPTKADPLPVLLRDAGNWLDRTGAVQHLNMIMPTGEQPVILTNAWSHGDKQLLSEVVFGSAVLLLSNVWTCSPTNGSQGDFLRGQGVTNAPIELAIPGGSGYYLLVVNNHVLPFIGRQGTLKPAAIWAWPTLPVMHDGVPRQEADISTCGRASVEGECLYLYGRLGRHSLRQSWELNGKSGLLELRVKVWIEPDW
jgi:hypothetical protein